MTRRGKRFKTLTAALVAAALIGPAQAAGTLNEHAAREAAAKILKGDPYGTSYDQIMKNIQSAQLITAGSVCGGRVKKPVWKFHVVVPKERNPSGDSKIDGTLAIDAVSGKLVCAGLPFLD